MIALNTILILPRRPSRDASLAVKYHHFKEKTCEVAMLFKCPTPTEHAIKRAKERMGLSPDGLVAWVKATYKQWMVINAQYLRDRGAKCSELNTIFYMNPWIPGTSVAMAMSADNVIKTIIDFEDTVPEQVKHKRAVIDVIDKFIEDNILSADKLMHGVLGTHVVDESMLSAYRAYCLNLIRFDDLVKISKMPKHNRRETLNAIRQ